VFSYNPNIKSKENEKEEENYDKSSIKELVMKDFEKIKDYDSLKKYLPQMISQNYQNKGLISKNTQINPLLNNYQEVLKRHSFKENIIKLQQMLK